MMLGSVSRRAELISSRLSNSQLVGRNGALSILCTRHVLKEGTTAPGSRFPYCSEQGAVSTSRGLARNCLSSLVRSPRASEDDDTEAKQDT
jgi:hypothetical protein